jgi:hypothetical protein
MNYEYTQLLMPVTKSLCTYLEKALCAVHGDNWWKRGVLSVLTTQQQGHVRVRRISSLADLDVASLLRILDQNWHDLAEYSQWPPEIRHYVKEAQTIRNRWAHAGMAPAPREDLYRDVDTLYRLVRALGASSDLLKIYAITKKQLLDGAPSPAPSPDERGSRPSCSPHSPVFLLKLGKAYYQGGFFNVSVDFQRYVRSDNGPVSIKVGNAATIQGRVSRDANPGTGAPRIFGGAALRDWFQKHFQLHDRVEVHFESPDSLRLSEPN